VGSSEQYTVKEVFLTVQGEGYHAGTPAIFIRLGGCNMWSGREETRQRDYQRNHAPCALWCDTEFTGGTRTSLSELDALLYDATPKPWPSLVVLTGGEPLLQADDDLIGWLRKRFATVAIETNGTVEPKFDPAHAWITVSPKQERSRIVLGAGVADEVKVVYPPYDPLQYADLAPRRFVQPLDESASGPLRWAGKAVEFAQSNPGWRVSLQTHKLLGVR